MINTCGWKRHGEGFQSRFLEGRRGAPPSGSSSRFYWATWSGHDLFTILHDGAGGPVQLAGNLPFTPLSEQYHPQDLRGTETALYWINQGRDPLPGEVMKLPLVAGAPIGSALPTRMTWAGSEPWAMTVDGANIYWVTLGPIWNGRRDGMLLRLSTGGGALSVLATDVSYPVAIAVDSQFVYYTTARSSGGVVRVPK